MYYKQEEQIQKLFRKMGLDEIDMPNFEDQQKQTSTKLIPIDEVKKPKWWEKLFLRNSCKICSAPMEVSKRNKE